MLNRLSLFGGASLFVAFVGGVTYLFGALIAASLMNVFDTGYIAERAAQRIEAYHEQARAISEPEYAQLGFLIEPNDVEGFDYSSQVE